MWTLVPRPPNSNIVSCKWLFTKKCDAHGTPIRFKARLVARGFSQIPGIDYHETFSPTLRITSFRLLLAMTAYLNLEVHHVDIETTFLHGDLEETIYMEQPKMMENDKYPDYVCKLNKPLYGLKQSPRQWYAKLHKFLLNANFTRLYSEPNLYVRKTNSEFIILGVYVDDLPIAGTSEKEILEVIKELQHHFPVKHLGPLEHFLGIHVQRNRSLGILSLSQAKYVDNILNKFDMAECSPISTPLTVPCKLSSRDSPQNNEEACVMKNIPYRQVLGSLRYLVSCTRPDLSFSTGFLSRFMEKPGLNHWAALKRVLRYLKYTRNMVLTYKAYFGADNSKIQAWLSTPLQGWTDADWGGDIDSSRSTSGFLFTFAGGAIAWRTKKQATVALSSTEAEYIAATLTAKEGLWIRSIIQELDILRISKFRLWCDNQSCVKITKNPKITDQNKHIRARYHFITELVEEHNLDINYTPTQDMWADFLTKPVPCIKHWNCCKNIGLSLSQ